MRIPSHFFKKLDVKPNQFFVILCALQFICWTFVPYATRGTLNHDVLEGLAWGFEWQLGYDKHPPLTAWLLSGWLGFTQKVGLNLDFSIYAIAQIVLLCAFYPMYRLSRALLPYRAAVVATTLLTGILYFNSRSMNLTPDTMQTPIWAWSIWIFYLALTQNSARYWLGLGVINALALWAKYSGVLLIFSEFLVLVCISDYRHYLNPIKNPKVYAALVLGVLLFLPHIAWLVSNDFLPLQYAKNLVINKTPRFVDHIIVIFQYLITQLPLLIIPVLMLWCFNFSQVFKKRTAYLSDQALKFILIMGLMPFILTIIQSVITGQKVIGRWSTPYYCCMGILLVLMLGKKQIENITDIQWNRYLLTWLSIFFLVLGLRHVQYFYAPYFGKVNSDVYFPTKVVTQQFERFWTDKTHKPLDYVIGDRYWTTYISVYAKSALPAHPHVFLEANSKMSPWVDLKALNKKGGMIIWLAKSVEETTLPSEYANLPRAQFVGVKAVPKNISVPAAPLLIGMGWIPPLDEVD